MGEGRGIYSVAMFQKKTLEPQWFQGFSLPKNGKEIWNYLDDVSSVLFQKTDTKRYKGRYNKQPYFRVKAAATVASSSRVTKSWGRSMVPLTSAISFFLTAWSMYGTAQSLAGSAARRASQSFIIASN